MSALDREALRQAMVTAVAAAICHADETNPGGDQWSTDGMAAIAADAVLAIDLNIVQRMAVRAWADACMDRQIAAKFAAANAHAGASTMRPDDAPT